MLILKPGFGYWRTNYYPIGGDFCRASKIAGKPIDSILRTFETPYKGCNQEVLFEDGTKGALDSNHTQEI